MARNGNGNSGISQKLIRHKSPVEEGNQRSLLSAMRSKTFSLVRTIDYDFAPRNSEEH